MVFRPHPQLIPQFFNTDGFGLPPAVRRGSPWPWIDHLASGLLEQAKTPISDLLSLRLPPLMGLDLLARVTRRIIMQKARPHPALRQGSDCFVGLRFQVLFHSASAVLFTFPSRYWYTIGFRLVFSPWKVVLPDFHPVPRVRWYLGILSIFTLNDFIYWTVTICGRPFQTLRLSPRQKRVCFATLREDPATPQWQRTKAVTPSEFRLLPVRSPLLGQSRN